MVKKTDNAREKSQSVSPKPERTELASGHDGKDAKERNVKKEMLAKQELETKEKQVIVEEIAIKKETENQVHAAALQSVEQRTSDKQADIVEKDNSSLIASVKSTRFNNSDLQSLIEVLISKQEATGSSSDWHKKATKDDPDTLLAQRSDEKDICLQDMDTAKPEMSSEKCSHYSKESVEKRRRPTCGQFFCKGCLRSCSNKNVEGNFSKDRLKCPSCGAINEMPDGLVDNLDSNDSTVVYKSSSTQEICVSCKNLGTSEKAVKFCRHCVDSFCQKCSIIFHSVEVFKHHEFVEIDYTLESVREIYLLREKSNLLKCSSHPTKKIKFHCLDHDRLCCSNCAFSNHRTCSKVVEIAKIPRNKNDTQDIKQKVSKISNDASDVIAQLTDTAEKTKTQESSVSEHLRQIRGNINNIFKNLEFKCTETAKLLTTRETQIIYKEIRKIQSLLDSLAVYASMLDKDDVDGSGCDHYIAKRKCLELLEIIKPTLMDLTQNSKIHTIACVYGTLLYDILNLDPNDTRKLVSIQECN